MGAGASSLKPDAGAVDLLKALDDLNKSAQAVPLSDQTAAQVASLAKKLSEITSVAQKLAEEKAKLDLAKGLKTSKASADDKLIGQWGLSTFKQFDTDKNGKLSKKELARALKSLPKTKPASIPEGAKFQSVEEMIAAMDSDGDGDISPKEWLDNLHSCPGLAAALAENVNAAGRVENFRSFEEQKAKREKEVKELEAKETRTEEEEKELKEYKEQIESLTKKIKEAEENAAKATEAEKTEATAATAAAPAAAPAAE